MIQKIHEGSKMFQEGSRRFQEDSRRLKKSQEGSRRFKNVNGERVPIGFRYIIVY